MAAALFAPAPIPKPEDALVEGVETAVGPLEDGEVVGMADVNELLAKVALAVEFGRAKLSPSGSLEALDVLVGMLVVVGNNVLVGTFVVGILVVGISVVDGGGGGGASLVVGAGSDVENVLGAGGASVETEEALTTAGTTGGTGSGAGPNS